MTNAVFRWWLSGPEGQEWIRARLAESIAMSRIRKARLDRVLRERE